MCYEEHFAQIAMSSSEARTAAVDNLYELNRCLQEENQLEENEDDDEDIDEEEGDEMEWESDTQ